MIRIAQWVVLMLAVSSLAIAQTPDTASIHGQVVDQSRAAVPGVQVELINRANGSKRKATTDAVGKFAISSLPVAGAYDLTASKQGFATARLQGITLTGGMAANLDVRLDPAGATTEITVTGVVGEIRTDEPQLGMQLSAPQIDEVPLPNRRITFLPLLNAANRPAINQGDVFMNENLFTANGTGRRQTWFEIDGSSGNDVWGRQTIFTNLPLDAVQEMAVLTNAFSAEYGFAAGAVVNIVTRSGSDRFHGDLEGLWRPADTSARLSGFTSSNATSGNQLTSDSLRQVAGEFSGPIGSSARTHFVVAGEYSWEDRASPITSPIAPGSYVGHYRGWLGFARLNQQIGTNHTLFLRAGADNFTDTNPNGTVGGNSLPTVARVFKRRTYSVVLGETAVLSPSVINNFRAQFQLASPVTQFQPVINSTQFVVPISAGGTFTSGTSQSALLQNRQYEFNDTLSAMRGRHALKFGGGFVRAHNGGNSKEFGGPIFLGQFTYNVCTQALAFCESPAYLNNIANVRTYTQSYGQANYTVDDTLWSLFAQDDVRLRNDLTINLGLRYERQTFTDSTLDFAPRIGFAYNVLGKGKTVVRGGYGIYYSQIVDNAEANYVLSGPKGVFNYVASPGQVGFPSSVSAAPLPAFPAGAVAPVRTLYIRPGRSAELSQFLPTSVLNRYPDALLNPYTQQWTLGIEQQLRGSWILSADYVGAHSIKVNRPLDINAPAPFVRTAPGQVRSAQAANCTRPFWVWWYAQRGLACNPTSPTNPQPPYGVVFTDVNSGFGYYNALDLNLRHQFSRRFLMMASYTWSHTINNVDPDVPGQNPNDPTFPGITEKGNAIFDQRHRFVLSGYYVGPLKISVGGIASLGSGLPFNIVTGVTNSGDTGATADRPVINGAVVGRNAGRGRSIYEISPFIERPFAFTESVHLKLRVEAFNVLNHPNFVGYSGTWGNGASAGPGFGQPLAGITNQLPARSLQFSAKLAF